MMHDAPCTHAGGPVSHQRHGGAARRGKKCVCGCRTLSHQQANYTAPKSEEMKRQQTDFLNHFQHTLWDKRSQRRERTPSPASPPAQRTMQHPIPPQQRQHPRLAVTMGLPLAGGQRRLIQNCLTTLRTSRRLDRPSAGSKKQNSGVCEALDFRLATASRDLSATPHASGG